MHWLYYGDGMDVRIEPDGESYKVLVLDGMDVLAVRTVASLVEAEGLMDTALSAGVEAFVKDSEGYEAPRPVSRQAESADPLARLRR